MREPVPAAEQASAWCAQNPPAVLSRSHPPGGPPALSAPAPGTRPPLHGCLPPPNQPSPCNAVAPITCSHHIFAAEADGHAHMRCVRCTWRLIDNLVQVAEFIILSQESVYSGLFTRHLISMVRQAEYFVPLSLAHQGSHAGRPRQACAEAAPLDRICHHPVRSPCAFWISFSQEPSVS